MGKVRSSINIDLDDPRTSKIADVISSKTSKKILNLLAEEEMSGSAIAEKLKLPLNTVSYNVKKLESAGLINKVGGFFWSVKGKRMHRYRVANKRIIITPKSFAAKVVPVLVAGTFIVLIALLLAGVEQRIESEELNQFEDYEDLKSFIEQSRLEASGGTSGGILEAFGSVAKASGVAAESADSGGGAGDYSSTNIQVKGVDEPDIVKNDGRYIYTVTGESVTIVDAFPAVEMNVVEEIDVGRSVLGLFVNGDRLVVFSQGYEQRDYVENAGVGLSDSIRAPSYGTSKVHVTTYDIRDRGRAREVGESVLEGNYANARMIGDWVYLISNNYIGNWEEPRLPMIEIDGIERRVEASEIRYFAYPDYGYSYLTVTGLNVDDLRVESEVYLTSSSSTMFMSKDNLYLTYYVNNWQGRVVDDKGDLVKNREKTRIEKFSISKGKVRHEATGEVEGRVLNQFSMDEYKGDFRIATTSGQFGKDSVNNVFVLDRGMSQIGSVEGLAEGERIYSARFVGDRGYMVTFKKVDPLFVIDLSEGKDPKVLGYLKIPGYSDYLQPYDENHVIGIGKDAVDASLTDTSRRNLDFAWYQGLKISIFDVTDVENPIESAKILIGDRGTESIGLRDHKAILFDKERETLVLPVTLAKIDESRYEGELPANAYGERIWQGAYVLDFKVDDIDVRGKITHYDEEYADRWYYGRQKAITRSLYMDDVLYTISGSKIKANDFWSVEEISEVSLGEVEDYDRGEVVY